MQSLLLEIGSEEIPARFVSVGLKSLQDGLTGVLDTLSLEYGLIFTYSTPRRLTVCIDDIPETQDDLELRFTGPSKKVAYDNNGNPTKAAEGFARSMNIAVSDLRIESTEKGEYVSADIIRKGRSTLDLLAEEIPKVISSLKLPKTMRWGEGNLKYFRPIQWITALYGEKLISIDLDGILSYSFSYGHRFLSPERFEIKNRDDYVSSLRKNFVLVDSAERKKSITTGLSNLESTNNFVINKDEELLDIVNNLVEYPVPVLGTFEKKFLQLPAELLITVMKSHQKYFSTEDNEGNISNSFVVISNTKPDNNDTVRKGAERVLRARLEDAQFYFDEDSKRPLSDHIEKLKNVTFQEELGTVYEKSERISSLASFIAENLGIEPDDQLKTASMLAKADLVTGVVGEFPELQGYMGMIYATNSGENEEVASAIYEHYMPRFAGDRLPSSEKGILIALADKIDNIASFFSIGQVPSGSEDPFALRRQAMGIINILQAKEYPLTLDSLIEKALDNLNITDSDKTTFLKEIKQFFFQRLEGMFLSQGYSHDVINASFSTGELNLGELKRKMNILSHIKKDLAFPSLLEAAKRVYNILAKPETGQLNPSLFKEPEENLLHNANENIQKELSPDDYSDLFKLTDPINNFFDKVLVMDKDSRIKENRLALLMTIKNSFDSLADFSKILDPRN